MSRSLKDTELLLQEIKEATNIYTYIKENTKELIVPTFSEYLLQLLTERNIKKSRFIYESSLSRQYAYEIFTGQKIPSRSKVLLILFSFYPSLDESQKLLTTAGHQPLYPKDLNDAIVIFGLQQKMPLMKLNDILYDLSLTTID